MEYLIRNIEDFHEVEKNNIPKKIHIIWKSNNDVYPQYLIKQLRDWALCLDHSWQIVFWISMLALIWFKGMCPGPSTITCTLASCALLTSPPRFTSS